jgi:hypothetical protein
MSTFYCGGSEYIEVYIIFTLVTIRLKSQLTPASVSVFQIIVHIYISSRLGTRCYIPCRVIIWYWKYIKLLNPTGHVMHHQQFNIQQLYALPTLYLCVLYLSKEKQRLVPLTA